MNILKTFVDGSYVFYDKGKFDEYCVYIKENNRVAKAPKDVEYFQYFIDISKKYRTEKIYSDFCEIYERTTENIDTNALSLITEISKSYNIEDILQVDKWFTVIYLGMIAEEKKANAILKKRIKRLGFHQIMLEGFSAQDAANYSKGKKASMLLQECNQRGF